MDVNRSIVNPTPTTKPSTSTNNSSFKKQQQQFNKENNNKKTKILSRQLSSVSIGAITTVNNTNNIKQKSVSTSSLTAAPLQSINGPVLNDVTRTTAGSATAAAVASSSSSSTSSMSHQLSSDSDDPETIKPSITDNNNGEPLTVCSNNSNSDDGVQCKVQRAQLLDQSNDIAVVDACVGRKANVKSARQRRPQLYNDFVNLICDSKATDDHNETKPPIVVTTEHCEGVDTKNGDGPNNDDDIKPLLFDYENEKKKPKSIVKSPSTKSFGANAEIIVQQTTSCFVDSEQRPVLHVQFMQHQNGIVHSMYPPIAAKATAECSSPASSVSSTSSSSGSSSSGDEEGSSIGQYSEAKPPDGGWGWVVVFASFIVNLIADGITFSFGVIYVEFLNYFNEGKAKTAWIGSLFMAMPLLSGPIASFLTDRYGCRKVTIVGSILASLGFMISSQAETMEMLFFTFGIVAGFGLSLCYVAAVVIVAYYFDKKRSLATGLSVCGSGIGTFIFAPLTQYLLETYGWRGTTLILAGLFLNMTVCGMLMRDLEWTTHRAKLKAKQRRKRSKLGISADSFSVSNSTNTGGTASNLQHGNGDGEDDGNNIEPVDPRLFSSLITLPTFMRNGEKVPVEVLELMATHRNIHQVLFQNYPGLAHSRSFSEPLSASRHSSGLSPEAMLSPTNPGHVRYEKSARNQQIRNEQAFVTWLRRDGANQKDVSALFK